MDEVLDRAPCGFISFGADGTVRDVNSTLLEMTGNSRESVVGKPFEALLTTSSRIFYQTHFFPLLKLQSKVEEVFLIFRCSSGSEDLAVLINASARAHARDGEVIYDCALIRLRERRKWEDEILRSKRAAEEANKAKSGLMSMMSHDLRTPIGAIGGYCDLLMMGIRGELNDAQLADVQRLPVGAHRGRSELRTRECRPDRGPGPETTQHRCGPHPDRNTHGAADGASGHRIST
jgi:PAS domain S-box-containing protein